VLRTIRAAGLGEGVAEAEFLPRISVGAVGARLDTNIANDQKLAAVGLNLEVPLFDGGRRIGKLKSARAEVRAAIAQGSEICDAIAYEVHTAYLLIDDARQRIALARIARESAAENLRIVRSLFDRGDATVTDVVDAELAAIRAQQNEFTARYDYQTALARLTYAIGVPATGATFPATSAVEKMDAAPLFVPRALP
jgi:outer membrane protein TolC